MALDAPSLPEIAAHLDACLDCERFQGDQQGIYLPSSRAVRRIGLALESWPGIDAWVEEARLDALFLHRPWRLEQNTFPPDVGVLAYHLAFDLTLTLCYNPRLAASLGMSDLVPCVLKDNLFIGMLGRTERVSLAAMTNRLCQVFARPPQIRGEPTQSIERVAVVGAMTRRSIEEAASLGAHLYVTGQFREPARKAMERARMAVAVIGHATCELWGLRALADLLRERWPSLDIIQR